MRNRPNTARAMVGLGPAASPVIPTNMDAKLRFNCKNGKGYELHLYRNPSLQWISP
jgi:hypothetical protein